MKNQGTAAILLLALLVAAAVGAAVFLLLILPEYNSASEARDDLAVAQSDNEFLELQIQQMQALAAEVPTWQEEIALVQGEMPATPEEAELRRLLVQTLESRDLPVVDITIGDPQVVSATSSEGFVLPDDSTEDSESSDVAATPEPEPTASDSATTETGTSAADELVQFEGLIGIPVVITTQGAPRPVMAALASLQSQSDRFFTVSNLTVSTATVTEEEPGLPELDESDWEVVVTGLVFSLLDTELSYPADEEGSVPSWDGDVDNVFEPLKGTGDTGE